MLANISHTHTQRCQHLSHTHTQTHTHRDAPGQHLSHTHSHTHRCTWPTSLTHTHTEMQGRNSKFCHLKCHQDNTQMKQNTCKPNGCPSFHTHTDTTSSFSLRHTHTPSSFSLRHTHTHTHSLIIFSDTPTHKLHDHKHTRL